MIIFSGRIVKLILPGASIAGEEQTDSQSIIDNLAVGHSRGPKKKKQRNQPSGRFR
jgi:hypothetical protein